MQRNIEGLCNSYGSVIALAVYVPVVARVPGSTESATSNAIELIKEEFDK
jgi:hypothetical protein